MKMKRYRVTIDMQWAKEYEVTAINVKHAKLKAWIKFTKRLPRRLFRLLVDKIDD
jgi:hypothetical protein